MSHRFSLASAVLLVAGLLCAPVPAAFAADLPATGNEGRPAFTIGLGDVLEIFILEEATRTEALVRPDGRITMPLAGDIEAEGLAPVELAARIKKALEPFQKDPTVTVTVRQINSYRIYLYGNVRNQMMIPSGTPLRLLQALAMGGGLNEFASGNVVVIRERRNGPALRIPINMKKITKGEALDLNIWLQAGDTVLAE